MGGVTSDAGTGSGQRITVGPGQSNHLPLQFYLYLFFSFLFFCNPILRAKTTYTLYDTSSINCIYLLFSALSKDV
jgi:hypothetical protein